MDQPDKRVDPLVLRAGELGGLCWDGLRHGGILFLNQGKVNRIQGATAYVTGRTQNLIYMTATASPAPISTAIPAPIKFISGGQTGADRAGLDVAIARGLSHGGWCPKGRKAEDGPLPARYCLTETPSASYLVRTERNAAESDATVIFTVGCLNGGSKRTAEFAKRHRRPFLHLSLVPGREPLAAEKLADFIRMHRVTSLNVAGSRESKAPGIHTLACSVLDITLNLLGLPLPDSGTARHSPNSAPRAADICAILS